MVTRRRHRRPPTVVKACGADFELGNFILGLIPPRGGSGYEASRALLYEVRGIHAHPVDDRGFAIYPWTYNAQDLGRRFLTQNGGCIYIDLNHLELCIPEVLNAFDHVAATHAMLKIAEEAREAAARKLTGGQSLKVLVNNSDGHGNSYGSHLSFLLTRRAWDNLFNFKLHHQAFLASYLASSIIISGAGKVGSENGRRPVAFQISQRADFMECMTGPQTTIFRPLVNSRDEPLADSRTLARLHVIFFDNTLAQVSSLLKVGVTQIVLAMIEREIVTTRLLLDDPVAAVIRWSHDPDLKTAVRLTSGRRVTAVEHQLELFDLANRFVEAGGTDEVVPRAGEVVRYWGETLKWLASGNTDALATRLDWVLKRQVLERTRTRCGLDWDSPEMARLDQAYADLDPEAGIYWACAREGEVETVVTPGAIERFLNEPPDDTRAWLRAQLLRRASEARVTSVDWDSIEFGFPGPWGTHYRRVEMANPLGSTRAACGAAFEPQRSLEETLNLLDARNTEGPAPRSGGSSPSPDSYGTNPSPIKNTPPEGTER